MASSASAASGSAAREHESTEVPAAVAWRPVPLIAGALGTVLLAFSARYGYHRDELYFRVAGRHLDWGYPDQPPLVPLIARAVTAVFGDSLVMLRTPSALAASAGVVVAALTAGKPYYLAGLWAALWAAGAVEVERRGAPRGWGWAVSVPAYALTAVSTVATTLPVYPSGMLADTPQPAINADAAETVGWPRFAAEVARVHRSLPPAERSRAVIFTANYGEAGALDRYGPALGLPRPYSAHNGYWYFGRPADTGGPVIVVGPEGPAPLQQYWAEVTVAGRIDNGVGLDNDEQGLPVWVCRGQREPWAVL